MFYSFKKKKSALKLKIGGKIHIDQNAYLELWTNIPKGRGGGGGGGQIFFETDPIGVLLSCVQDMP